MKRALAFALLALVSVAPAQTGIGVKPPKLVVVISIDQYRADFLKRFAPYYLPARSAGRIGGFKFLAETGADYLDAHHNHLPTATGPGHASLLTGSEPALNGIAGNDWYSRELKKVMYCVEDPSVQTVGGKGEPMSPKNLTVTTLGDELKMATNGKSKVVGIALKDRGSILMAGHSGDTVLWFDNPTGNWVSSTHYCPTGQLPGWVQKFNSERRVDKYAGQVWEPLLPASAYAISRPAPHVKPEPGKIFARRLPSEIGPFLFSGIWSTSHGNEHVFVTAEKALDEEQLGKDEYPDILAISLSNNDYIGHAYGPNSPEVMDISIRTDRLLSSFFTAVDRRIGIDNVVIVLTADHGVVPIVEESRDVYRTGVQRASGTAVKNAVTAALEKRFGAGEWFDGAGFVNHHLYLNHATIEGKNLNFSQVEEVAARAAASVPGVYHAFTRTQVLNGMLPDWDWVKLVSNGYHPSRSGDVVVIESPGAYFGGGTGTGHGAPWGYDSHVPIVLRGPGITAGRYGRRVTTADIASTLCHLLGVEYPTGNIGSPLREALERK